jgi:hypothetical protein
MILVALDSITMINIKERKDQNTTKSRDEDMFKKKITGRREMDIRS